jgi:hypothetical protein
MSVVSQKTELFVQQIVSNSIYNSYRRDGQKKITGYNKLLVARSVNKSVTGELKVE